VRDAVRAGELSSAHDIAEGGFLVAVAECCLAGAIGAELDLGHSDAPLAHLFGEGPGGFVVSGSHEALERLGGRTPLDVFGAVGGDELSVAIAGERLSISLAELSEASGALQSVLA
jgi:phosphoribosylformylglycinamidine synthase